MLDSVRVAFKLNLSLTEQSHTAVQSETKNRKYNEWEVRVCLYRLTHVENVRQWTNTELLSHMRAKYPRGRGFESSLNTQ